MTCRSNELAFVTFSRNGNEKLFHEYLKIKYDVFVEEMRWDKIPHVKANRMTLADPYDDEGIFCAGVDKADKLVAVARGTLPKRFVDMYRAQWYANFAMLDLVRELDGKIATINAVTVRRENRGGCEGNSSPQIHISDLLMKNIMSELTTIGADVIVLSAIAGPAYSLMRCVGFKIINLPSVYLVTTI